MSKMIYRRLGNTGLKVSVLSYGAWVSFSTQLGVDAAYEIMKEAYAAGVNFFDNAEAYAAGEAETIMGECIKLGEKEGIWKRSDLVLSTKLFFGDGSRGPNDTGLSRKHIIEGMKKSLARFQLEYVDLVFCHRPDPNTPIEETVRAMNYLIDNGMAFYWGTSEWTAEQLHEACDIADKLGLEKPMFEQPEYNLFHREKVEKDFVSLYERMGLGLTVWSPLASGMLTGKYSGGKIPEGSRMHLPEYKWLSDRLMDPKNAWRWQRTDELKTISDELGCSQAQLALAWCVKNEHVSTVILGATKMDQIRENLKTLEFVEKMDDKIMQRIEDIMKTKPKM